MTQSEINGCVTVNRDLSRGTNDDYIDDRCIRIYHHLGETL